MKIAVLPGDGIGPEIVRQAVKVIERLKADGLAVETATAPIGGAGFEAAGGPPPHAALDLPRRADAILLGAVGGPKFDTLDRTLRPEQGLLRIRKALGLFTNLRPAMVYEELADASSLRPELVAGLDIMILRELTGDIYFGSPRGRRTLDNGEREGFDTMKYSESEIRRIAHVGFAIARRRGKKLCSVDKANVLDTSILWREVVNEVAREYPDVELSHMYVDNAAMQLVRAPIHGSAPDIAGRDIANPLATILSVAMMLRYTFANETAAARIEAAVRKVLRDGVRTGDIAKPGERTVGTEEMGDAVLAALVAQR